MFGLAFFLKFNIIKIQLLVFFILFSGCTKAQENNSIYLPGREFVYNVQIRKNGSIIQEHTIRLKTMKDGWPEYVGQTPIKYIYGTIGKSLKETTGVVDDPDYIYLHPPRMSFMSFAEIPPQPSISLPPKIGNNSTTELKIQKAVYENLAGKTITQTKTITNQEDLKMFGKIYRDVWVIKGKNTSHIEELGQYHVSYWFHKKYGFIRMKYEKPNDEIVDVRLQKAIGF